MLVDRTQSTPSIAPAPVTKPPCKNLNFLGITQLQDHLGHSPFESIYIIHATSPPLSHTYNQSKKRNKVYGVDNTKQSLDETF